MIFDHFGSNFGALFMIFRRRIALRSFSFIDRRRFRLGRVAKAKTVKNHWFFHSELKVAFLYQSIFLDFYMFFDPKSIKKHPKSRSDLFFYFIRSLTFIFSTLDLVLVTF